jgi:hypothetical protein
MCFKCNIAWLLDLAKPLFGFWSFRVLHDSIRFDFPPRRTGFPSLQLAPQNCESAAADFFFSRRRRDVKKLWSNPTVVWVLAFSFWSPCLPEALAAWRLCAHYSFFSSRKDAKKLWSLSK